MTGKHPVFFFKHLSLPIVHETHLHFIISFEPIYCTFFSIAATAICGGSRTTSNCLSSFLTGLPPCKDALDPGHFTHVVGGRWLARRFVPFYFILWGDAVSPPPASERLMGMHSFPWRRRVSGYCCCWGTGDALSPLVHPLPSLCVLARGTAGDVAQTADGSTAKPAEALSCLPFGLGPALSSRRPIVQPELWRCHFALVANLEGKRTNPSTAIGRRTPHDCG